MNRASLLVFLLLIFLMFLVFPNLTGNIMNDATGETAVVSRVIDGDTLELGGSGEKVRLLGINTPERGQWLYAEAKERLAELILEKRVRLEDDVTDRDKYDRLLRYVYADGENLNIRMVREGFASVYIIEPDNKYTEELLAAEEEARNDSRGIWQYSNITDAFCIGLYYPFMYNAKGDDRENLNGEYLILRNSCTYPVELSGWTLMDNSSSEYIFREFVLMNKSTVTIHTGTGTDNETDLYWGMSRPVWNNNGDVLYLWNMYGELVLKYGY